MVEYNYTKQINSDELYINILTNVGVTPSLFNYDIVTFHIKIRFENSLTSQQEIDLDATVDAYVYEELVRTYSLIPIVDVDSLIYNTSYVGYGYESSCKIQKVSTNSSGYTTSWASGNEVFDKIWSNRYNYTYF